MKIIFTANWRQMELTMAAAALIGAGVTAASTGGQMIWQGKTNKKTRQWNEKMYGIQREDALEDWNRNNAYNSPDEQVKRLKEAGLNPALMYGGGPQPGGQSQPVRGSEVEGWNPGVPNIQGMGIQGAQLLMQMKMQEAQIENLKADSNKKNVEASKTGGVDTQETQANIQKLIAETANEQAKNALIQLQSRAQQLENQFNAGTIEHRKSLVYETFKQAESTTGILANQKDISDATKQTQIEQVKASLGETITKIALNTANIDKVKAETGLTEEQIKAVSKSNAWYDIIAEKGLAKTEAETKNLNNQRTQHNLSDSDRQAWDAAAKILQALGIRL